LCKLQRLSDSLSPIVSVFRVWIYTSIFISSTLYLHPYVLHFSLDFSRIGRTARGILVAAPLNYLCVVQFVLL
jgi:hypothetical protein